MRTTPSAAAEGRRAFRLRPSAWLIIVYWVGQFGFLTAERQLETMGKDPPIYMLPRAFMALVGVGLSFAIDAWQRRHGQASWTRRILLSVCAALVAAMLHATINFCAFQLIVPEDNWKAATVSTIFMATVQWMWTYAAISALLLTASYSDALRERERRLIELQGMAHSAQLRSLRYQLNPHFMFNTLNSIAALIAGGRAGPAEQMVENLADFLRASLALDPNDDLTLASELELQSLYLSIEAARFPARLSVETILPAELGDVLLPSLILQPLVENAIKHGIARNATRSTLRIEAARAGERLRLTVSNEIPGGDLRASGGTSVGLANVARRIDLRYGGEGRFEAGPQGNRFVVTLELPIHRRL